MGMVGLLQCELFVGLWSCIWCLQVAGESESTDSKSDVEVSWLRDRGMRGLHAQVELV